MARRRAGTEGRSRGSAWLALALLAFVFGAPCLVRALEPSPAACCARGRCCCAPQSPETGACWRVACGCGRHDAGEVRLVSLDPALPVRPPQLRVDRVEGEFATPVVRVRLLRPAEAESPPPRPRIVSS